MLSHRVRADKDHLTKWTYCFLVSMCRSHMQPHRTNFGCLKDAVRNRTNIKLRLPYSHFLGARDGSHTLGKALTGCVSSTLTEGSTVIMTGESFPFLETGGTSKPLGSTSAGEEADNDRVDSGGVVCLEACLEVC